MAFELDSYIRRDPKQKAIAKSSIVLYNEVKTLNKGALQFMTENMVDKHKDSLGIRAHRVRFNGRSMRDIIYSRYGIPEPRRLEPMLLMNMYMYTISSSNDFDFGYTDLLMPLKPIVDDRTYDFYNPGNENTNGFYSGKENIFWMSVITENMRKGYEEAFEVELENIVNQYELEEEFLTALARFPIEYMKSRGGCVSTGYYLSFFVHEYLHFIYDQMNLKRPPQTVNEAFSWFATYLIGDEKNIPIGSPGQSYNDPDRIEELAKALLDKYRTEADLPPVSWIIEIQVKITGSELDQLEALERILN